MRKGAAAAVGLWVLLAASCAKAPEAPPTARASSRCKTCHLSFYEKWSTSHHGLAMRPFTPELAREQFTPQSAPIRVGDAAYQVRFDEREVYIEERGPRGRRKYRMEHVMGGKNVYYVLTPMERGRLQVLPLAYDVAKKSWYDVAASGVRMHAEGPPDAPLPWTDSAFTFNTSCYSCHVSQLKTNYDAATDTYRSEWAEPGINCETCHGPGDAHIALFQALGDKGRAPPADARGAATNSTDMRILRVADMSTAQRNEMCAPCHAKMSAISSGYEVTQRFFDHYDLVTLEDPDFYPDGRDLGENYTYTGWLMSPCVKGGNLDCLHCHTSSGRYRFAKENPNDACLPCHAGTVRKAEEHSRHKDGTSGGRCVDCHMPKTRFAAMMRSDHSMLPPAPAATLAFRSPNACNLCHGDRDAAWADGVVRKWHKRDYQKKGLERASLVAEARRRDWRRIGAMLAYVGDRGEDVVVRTSLVRLLRASEDQRKWGVLQKALADPSPLVRAAAAEGLAGIPAPEVRAALARAARDEYRLVRIRAAGALGSVPTGDLPANQQEAVSKANGELLASLQARPDDFASQTNLGNFYMDRGQLDLAIASFERAIRLRPDSAITLVNASLAYSRAGRLPDAERVLDQALRYAPDNAAANFNRGLLMAELQRSQEAEAALKRALGADPTLGQAAFNLCVLIAQQGRREALQYCRQAVEGAQDNEKFAFTLAYYLDRFQDTGGAIEVLEAFRARRPAGVDTQMLLADLYVRSGKPEQAQAVYRATLQSEDLAENQRAFIDARLRALAGVRRE